MFYKDADKLYKKDHWADFFGGVFVFVVIVCIIAALASGG